MAITCHLSDIYEKKRFVYVVGNKSKNIVYIE